MSKIIELLCVWLGRGGFPVGWGSSGRLPQIELEKGHPKDAWGKSSIPKVSQAKKRRRLSGSGKRHK